MDLYLILNLIGKGNLMSFTDFLEKLDAKYYINKACLQETLTKAVKQGHLSFYSCNNEHFLVRSK